MSQNTSALTISNYRRVYVQYVSYNTYWPKETITDQELINKSFTPIKTVNVESGKVFQVATLDARTDGNVSFHSGDKFDITIFFYTFYDSYRGLDGKTIVPIVQCPVITGSNALIDNCDIVYHDMTDSPIDLTPLSTTTPTPDLPAAVQNKLHGYYALKVYGHFTADGNGNVISLRGPLVSAYNATSLTLPFTYTIGFSSLRVYTEVPDEDKAAEEISERNQKEYDSVDNIDNQSASDAQGSTNSQTTSLINTLNGFVSAFNNIQPSANCNMTLPFPEFLGGNTNVNICQGKDKAPQLIAIGSSLLLITTFVPLAYILVKMIYNEIRSWTNG